MKYEIANNQIMVEEENETKTYEIIACIPVNDKKFLVYSDSIADGNGNVKLNINSIVEGENGLVLSSVSEEEFREVINILRERMSE